MATQVLSQYLSGIGVDDMFIIIQALETLDDEHKREPIHIKMGHVLKRAGVSITVTSLTDVAAFAIGATTVLISIFVSLHVHYNYYKSSSTMK